MRNLSEKLYQDAIIFNPAEFNHGLFSAFMNYPPGKDIPQTVKSILMENLLPHIGETPLNYQYRMLQIDGRDAHQTDVLLDDTYHLNGNLVYRLLRGCTHVFAHLISTPGKTVHDPVETYIYYAYFNTLLQMAADHLRLLLTRNINIPDIRLTRRYAPGYCGWPIEDQSVLLNMLKPASIGVRFSESLMLEPVHSISGIFGLREKSRISGNMPCYYCTSLTCKVHDDFNRELVFIKGEDKS